MRKLMVFIWTMLVLGAMVPSCSNSHRYDNRLMAADSLIHDHADSAMALLEALSSNDLATDGDRAYRDLLLVQARYKAYVTATSDSDINYALAYYKQHPKEKEKLTRANIYKGAVMEELGHPDSALLYFKTAETTADPDDYYNLGYSKMRIVLYIRMSIPRTVPPSFASRKPFTILRHSRTPIILFPAMEI